MKRIIGALIAAGLGVGTAAAQELELKPPQLSAGSICSPSLQARCAGISQPGLDHDLACDRCGPEVMPSDIVNPPERFSSPNRLSSPGRSSSPARPSSPGRSPAPGTGPSLGGGGERTPPAECTLGQMPLGPTLPGCTTPPLDHIPQP